MSSPQQFKNNAQWVIDNFGPQSGVPQFGFNTDSIAYLDSFIDNQGESFRANEQSANRIVSLLGSFLGEAIISNYGGQWEQNPESVTLSIESDDYVHLLQPFQKVHNRLVNGAEDSLQFYFSSLPQILAESPSNGPVSVRDTQPKKPWWKLF